MEPFPIYARTLATYSFHLNKQSLAQLDLLSQKFRNKDK